MGAAFLILLCFLVLVLGLSLFAENEAARRENEQLTQENETLRGQVEVLQRVSVLHWPELLEEADVGAEVEMN